jgi:hypothetical protein
MDKAFYDRIAQNRAQQQQSPYVSGFTNLVEKTSRRLRNKSESRSPLSLIPGAGGMASNPALAGVDFYGEKIRSVSDYRIWLRRQRKLDKEHGVART